MELPSTNAESGNPSKDLALVHLFTKRRFHKFTSEQDNQAAGSSCGWVFFLGKGRGGGGEPVNMSGLTKEPASEQVTPANVKMEPAAYPYAVRFMSGRRLPGRLCKSHGGSSIPALG